LNRSSSNWLQSDDQPSGFGVCADPPNGIRRRILVFLVVALLSGRRISSRTVGVIGTRTSRLPRSEHGMRGDPLPFSKRKSAYDWPR
jgi:hypothetical protein